MKLEELLNELEIPEHALDMDLREALEEIAERYLQDTENSINIYNIIRIAESTKDKGAVIEAANTIMKYKGYAANEISYVLENIASITKDKNKIIKIARIMSLDEIVNSIKNAEHILNLTEIAGYTGDKNAVIEAAKTIRRYEGGIATYISYGLGYIAENTKDNNIVTKAARIMSLDEIVEIANSVKDAEYGEYGRSLTKIAGYTGDKDVVIEAAKTIMKYKGYAANTIAYELENIAENTRDKNKIIKIARIMSLDEIVNYAQNTMDINKLVQIAGYTGDKDAVIEAEKTIMNYKGNTAFNIAYALGGIAAIIEDKDVVIEAAKTIMKYKGYAANTIAYELENIASITKDKNKIIKAARIMSLDEIVNSVKDAEYGEYGRSLTEIAGYTGDKDAVIEAEKTIVGYEGDTANEIANILDNIAENTKDRDKVIKAARIMSLDEIVNYVQDTPVDINLIRIAGYTGDKDAVIEAEKTMRKYERNIAWNIVHELGYIAKNTKDRDKVIKTVRIMSLDEIVEIVNSVKDAEYAHNLTEIAGYTGNKDAVIEATKVIRKYEGETAENIADRLGRIAESIEDKDAVIEAANTIGKYEENTANEIAYKLRDIAQDTKDKSTLMAACRITNLVGADVFDILTGKDFLVVKSKKLDDLINSKESFDAVAAYIKSGYELPMPSKDNITNYKNVASEYISKEYSIKNSNLNTNQILMLFSVDKAKRKKLADLIDNSNEIGLKMYNIATEETKRLEVDDKLPYLSIIAVTGSRNKDMDNEAYKRISGIVGEKAVRKARNEFSSHYKNKIKEIAGYIKKNEIDKAIDYLKSTKNEAIEDVLRCADYRDFSLTGGNTILKAVESNNPLDYDNRTQIACVYLPNDYPDGIYNYCRNYYSRDKDKGFVLVRYDIGGKALGSAICYMENDKFLVDSVEGHRTFRKPQIFKAVYQDLVDRAREKGAKRAIFSDRGTNETPIKFMEFIGSLGPKRGNIKMKLDTEGYLEANRGVSGYIVNL